MDEAPTLISPAERNRRLARLVTAAQRALEAMENPVARVWPDTKDKGEYHECFNTFATKEILTVVDGQALAKELREGLEPFMVGAPKREPIPASPSPTSTALAHLSTFPSPREFKLNDTVRLLHKDSYRGIKAGELGKVVKVHTNGKWLDIRWRSHHAHDLTTKASHVELVADA
ncbi:hypothetical protein UFOVP783_115 [uncultured Caudovirales phage]|uniref:Uncharacterized protein n=1 Tax=uncultured Caudovirales phage TaxID=2100421 RepID=A0A6J5P085_9CAUD|nr:hypothetical protein UFOVP783_115 [uncultured Caudovirales phage]